MRPASSTALLLLAGWMAVSPALAQEDGGGEGGDGAAPSSYDSRRGEEAGDSRRSGKRKSGKGGGSIDPKVFEARGRELQGEYYEIPALAKAPSWSAEPADLSAGPEDPKDEGDRRNWVLWGGVAGAAACVAGIAGWLLLEQPGNAEPVTVHLDDKP